MVVKETIKSDGTVLQSWHDLTKIEIAPNGEWSMRLPNGKLHRGSAPDIEAAKVAVKVEHDRYVLEAWETGLPSSYRKKQFFLVPLG